MRFRGSTTAPLPPPPLRPGEDMDPPGDMQAGSKWAESDGVFERLSSRGVGVYWSSEPRDKRQDTHIVYVYERDERLDARLDLLLIL